VIFGITVPFRAVRMSTEIDWNQFRDFRLSQWNEPTIVTPSSPPPSAMDNIWIKAVNSATKAANLAQMAKTQQQWNRVVLQWQQAINL